MIYLINIKNSNIYNIEYSLNKPQNNYINNNYLNNNYLNLEQANLDNNRNSFYQST